ncbi:MAG: hypothetical protein PHS41_10775 [Victivallaceae bacterium]|nr:hypothetical protein [Victivallaceae bacterium]
MQKISSILMIAGGKASFTDSYGNSAAAPNLKIGISALLELDLRTGEIDPDSGELACYPYAQLATATSFYLAIDNDYDADTAPQLLRLSGITLTGGAGQPTRITAQLPNTATAGLRAAVDAEESVVLKAEIGGMSASGEGEEIVTETVFVFGFVLTLSNRVYFGEGVETPEPVTDYYTKVETNAIFANYTTSAEVTASLALCVTTTELTETLASYSLATHTHDYSTTFAAIDHTHDFSATFAALSHFHPLSDVSNLSDLSDTYSVVGHTHDFSAVYAAVDHTHDFSAVYAAVDHTHDFSAVYAAVDHTHDFSATFAAATHHHALSALSDVAATGIADGQALVWSTSENKFTPVTISTSESTHSHSNKAVLDTVTAAVVDHSHSHSNKTILDTITSELIAEITTNTNNLSGVESALATITGTEG